MRFHLTLLGFAFRWLLAGVLVFSTWNTAGTSLLHLIAGDSGLAMSTRSFLAILLAVLWLIALRTAHLGLGTRGLAAMLLILGTFTLVLLRRGLLVVDSSEAALLLGMLGLTTLLALGWTWAFISHRLTGQGDIIVNGP
ncbi:MAG: hypothetical protein OHK0024_11990 [Thalassobaculales bacterium]